MRKKTSKLVAFIEGLHDFIITHPQFRKQPKGKSEVAIQTEIRPLIIRYLEKHFDEAGYTDAVAKANKSFYWEGQEGKYGRERGTIFSTRSYPDFIIVKPYLIAIEYKKNQNPSVLKQLIAQSMVHTLSGEFHYTYCLFHDESTDKKILKSVDGEAETKVINSMCENFNVFMKFV